MMLNKRLISMVPEARGFIVRKTLVNWLSTLTGICLWFTVSYFLEDIFLGHITAQATGAALAVVLACIALRFWLTSQAAVFSHKASACVKTRLRQEIYDKLSRLGNSYTDGFATSEIVQLAGEGVEQLESYFGNYLPQLMYSVLAPLTLFAVFLPLSPLTAVVLLGCVPLIPASIMAVQKIAKGLLQKYWRVYTNLGDDFLENLQGLTTLKVFGADGQRHEAMNRRAEDFRQITMKVLTMQLNSVTVMDLVAYGGTALGSILGARDFAAGKVSLGGALAMVFLASEFFLAMRSLGSYFHIAMNGMAASKRMFELLDLPEEEEGLKIAPQGDIHIRKLDFSYNRDKKALSGLTLIIPRGSLVAVVGKSGCGKSTLAAILSGSRRDYVGKISLGGTELREITAKSLSQTVTVVGANSYIFGGTLRKTLLEGKRTAEEADMRRALEQVRLLDFVDYQGGLDMPLAERGANLSGGQRQRLALARALLKNSPIYIFDEATSNIDAESEESIMAVIRSLRGNHTVLLISHRLANVTGSDKILFLENGKLVQQGSHRQLMEEAGGYGRLFLQQQALENIGQKEGIPWAQKEA